MILLANAKKLLEQNMFVLFWKEEEKQHKDTYLNTFSMKLRLLILEVSFYICLKRGDEMPTLQIPEPYPKQIEFFKAKGIRIAYGGA